MAFTIKRMEKGGLCLKESMLCCYYTKNNLSLTKNPPFNRFKKQKFYTNFRNENPDQECKQLYCIKTIIIIYCSKIVMK